MIFVLGLVLLVLAAHDLYVTAGGIVEGTGGPNFLSPSDIRTVAINAGFSGNDLITAVAIALAESGGNADAYNPEILAGTPSGQGSKGLWQIYTKVHPELDSNLYDAQTNADAAFVVYQQAGNSFRPWSTFKSGAYSSHLDSANPLSAGLTDPNSSDIFSSLGYGSEDA